MKQKRLNPLVLLLISTLACVIPGLSTPVPGPVDLNMLSTIVVLTIDAAVSQTAAAQSVATEIPAGTIVPGMTGTTIEQVQDGATKYSDHEVGFEITFPAGWLTLRPNSDEFNAALVNEAVKNDLLRAQMELDLTDYEPGADRLYSYPLRPDIEKNIAFGFSELTWAPNDTVPINENSMGGLVRDFESSGAIPGFRVDTAQIYENGNQVKLIEVGGQFSLSNDLGEVTPFYVTVVFFKPTSGSTTRISFVYWKDYKLPIYEDVTSVINSIKLLDQ